MKAEDVAAMMEETALPYAYYQFPEGTGQEPPFLCYYYTDDVDLQADDRNYVKIRRIVIELYTDEKDFVLEQRVEDTLDAHELAYAKQETHLPSERMYMVIYQTSIVLERMEDNA